MIKSKVKNPKWILSRNENGDFFFSLTAKNGRKILQSEIYKTKAKALNGIFAIIDCVYFANIEDLTFQK